MKKIKTKQEGLILFYDGEYVSYFDWDGLDTYPLDSNIDEAYLFRLDIIERVTSKPNKRWAKEVKDAVLKGKRFKVIKNTTYTLEEI